MAFLDLALITEKLVEKELSWNELARKTNISRQTIYNLRDTEKVPSMTTVMKLCEVLGLSVGEIVKHD